MSIIVRGAWSPLNLSGAGGGSYGILGHAHPDLPDYVWVEWIDSDGWQTKFISGAPAEGFYDRSNLITVGTAVFG